MVVIKTEIQNASRYFAHQCNCHIFSTTLRLEREVKSCTWCLTSLPSQNRNIFLDSQVKYSVHLNCFLFVLDKYLAPHSEEGNMELKPIPMPAKHSLQRVPQVFLGILSQRTPARGQLATLGAPLKKKIQMPLDSYLETAQITYQWELSALSQLTARCSYFLHYKDIKIIRAPKQLSGQGQNF